MTLALLGVAGDGLTEIDPAQIKRSGVMLSVVSIAGKETRSEILLGLLLWPVPPLTSPACPNRLAGLLLCWPSPDSQTTSLNRGRERVRRQGLLRRSAH